MKARNISERLIVLCEGTQLIPTTDPVTITTKEKGDKFTTLLVKKGSIVLTEQTTPDTLDEESTPDTLNEETATEEQELRKSLSEKNKNEILDILTVYGVEMNNRETKDAMIDKVVEIAKENGEI